MVTPAPHPRGTQGGFELNRLPGVRGGLRKQFTEPEKYGWQDGLDGKPPYKTNVGVTNDPRWVFFFFWINRKPLCSLLLATGNYDGLDGEPPYKTRGEPERPPYLRKRRIRPPQLSGGPCRRVGTEASEVWASLIGRSGPEASRGSSRPGRLPESVRHPAMRIGDRRRRTTSWPTRAG
jgi:hypothetical protein